MSTEKPQDKRFRRHANHHFASYAGRLPGAYSPILRSTYLKRHGFERIARGYYRKDFSRVLELRVLLRQKVGTFYDWILNTDRFGRMNQELKALNTRVARETIRLRRLMKEDTRQTLRDGEPTGDFLNQLKATAKAVKREVTDFRFRYEEFLGIVDEAHAVGPYYRTRSFCFDACTTTHELALFTEFVTLYMQVFRGLRVSRSGKAFTAEEVREAITAYYVYYAAIKNIRDLWGSGSEVQFGHLEKRFPTIGRQMLEEMTFESGSRGWESRAHDLALDLASDHSNTTVGNLRQMLKADKAYARQVKKQVAAIKDIEKVLSHRARVPALWPFGPKRQQEERANQIIRSVLMPSLPG